MSKPISRLFAPEVERRCPIDKAKRHSRELTRLTNEPFTRCLRRVFSAFNNLITISGDTGGLGLDDFFNVATQLVDDSVWQVTYDDTPGQPTTADGLSKLANMGEFGTPIVITALNGGKDPTMAKIGLEMGGLMKTRPPWANS